MDADVVEVRVTTEWTNRLLGDGTLAYYEHDGGHGTVPSDWPVFLQFLTTHLAP